MSGETNHTESAWIDGAKDLLQGFDFGPGLSLADGVEWSVEMDDDCEMIVVCVAVLSCADAQIQMDLGHGRFSDRHSVTLAADQVAVQFCAVYNIDGSVRCHANGTYWLSDTVAWVAQVGQPVGYC